MEGWDYGLHRVFPELNPNHAFVWTLLPIVGSGEIQGYTEHNFCILVLKCFSCVDGIAESLQPLEFALDLDVLIVYICYYKVKGQLN